MIKVKVFVSADDPDFGSALKTMLEGENCIVVESKEQANYRITINSSDEALPSIQANNNQGGNLVIGGTQTIGGSLNINTAFDQAKQQINNAPALKEGDKTDLSELMALLELSLKREERTGNAEDAQAVAKQAKAVVDEATKSDPKWYQVKIEAENLVKAAQNLALTTPYVLPIAQDILNFALQYAV